jgi:hypothetical protein
MVPLQTLTRFRTGAITSTWSSSTGEQSLLTASSQVMQLYCTRQYKLPLLVYAGLISMLRAPYRARTAAGQPQES